MKEVFPNKFKQPLENISFFDVVKVLGIHLWASLENISLLTKNVDQVLGVFGLHLHSKLSNCKSTNHSIFACR